jgi:hypothetical protein
MILQSVEAIPLRVALRAHSATKWPVGGHIIFSASVLMRFTGLENRNGASFCDWPKGSEMKTEQATAQGGCGKLQTNFGN